MPWRPVTRHDKTVGAPNLMQCDDFDRRIITLAPASSPFAAIEVLTEVSKPIAVARQAVPSHCSEIIAMMFCVTRPDPCFV